MRRIHIFADIFSHRVFGFMGAGESTQRGTLLLAREAVLKGADIFVKGVRAASMGLTTGSVVTVYVDIAGQQNRGSVCESLIGMRLIGTGMCLLDRSALFSAVAAHRLAHVAVRISTPACRQSQRSTL